MSHFLGVALAAFVGSFVGVTVFSWRTVRALWREWRERDLPF